jgi:hypothetical protein
VEGTYGAHPHLYPRPHGSVDWRLLLKLYRSMQRWLLPPLSSSSYSSHDWSLPIGVVGGFFQDKDRPKKGKGKGKRRASSSGGSASTSTSSTNNLSISNLRALQYAEWVFTRQAADVTVVVPCALDAGSGIWYWEVHSKTTAVVPLLAQSLEGPDGIVLEEVEHAAAAASAAGGGSSFSVGLVSARRETGPPFLGCDKPSTAHYSCGWHGGTGELLCGGSIHGGWMYKPRRKPLNGGVDDGTHGSTEGGMSSGADHATASVGASSAHVHSSGAGAAAPASTPSLFAMPYWQGRRPPHFGAGDTVGVLLDTGGAAAGSRGEGLEAEDAAIGGFRLFVAVNGQHPALVFMKRALHGTDSDSNSHGQSQQQSHGSYGKQEREACSWSPAVGLHHPDVQLAITPASAPAAALAMAMRARAEDWVPTQQHAAAP